MASLFNQNALLFVLALAALVPVPSLAATSPSCDEAIASIEQARQSGNLVQLRALYRQADEPCPAEVRTKVGIKVALAHLPEARRLIAGDRPDEARALLEKALEFGQSWQVLASLGDLASQGKASNRAAMYYDRALNAMTDSFLTPVAPDSLARNYATRSKLIILLNRGHACK